MNIDWRVMITVISGIVILESIALLKGINGLMLTTVIGVLALIGGVTLPQLKTKE